MVKIMQLKVRLIDHCGDRRHFMWTPQRLEIGFDFISQLVANGDTLLEVTLTEDNKSVGLPLEAFDGTPFSSVMGSLKEDWEESLRKVDPFKQVRIGSLYTVYEERLSQPLTRIARAKQLRDHVLKRLSHLEIRMDQLQWELQKCKEDQ
jgi:hypothetical protein